MNILNIVFFVILMIVGIMVFRYLFVDQNTLTATNDGKMMMTINASSLPTNGSNVPLNNFAYSIWFYVNDWNYRYGESKVIFGRMGSPTKEPTNPAKQGNGGSGGSSSDSAMPAGVSGEDPCPAVVLDAVENNLSVSIGCYPGVDEKPTTPGGTTVIHTCSVANVPIQRWVNLIVSVFGRTMDIYLDGKLVKTCLMPGIACVNHNSSVYITPGGGFDGWTGRFQYYATPLNPQEAWNIYGQGYSGYSGWLGLNSYGVRVSVLQNGSATSSVTL